MEERKPKIKTTLGTGVWYAVMDGWGNLQQYINTALSEKCKICGSVLEPCGYYGERFRCPECHKPKIKRV